ncbi:hypothetical protein Q4508_12445 [Amphritea sp. 2_MG-2023]|uniref:hypothetical protein n=1 Tax=Amphritea TaxID=515417 RepID=UPI001C075215|nr:MULTISPECIES: hypothetical protein [Amphritea]MBU2967086.1 hypothetical protein [Amphritea atlantica]MDO6419361.1 hypothetical protein [Amphritea sp. 2_MG-2023]
MTATAVIEREGHRKPAQLEMIGGKCARQRIWEQLRIQRDGFQVLPIAQHANAEIATVQTYLLCLKAGGYVETVSRGHLKKAVYRLVKDDGLEAPRLTRNGEPVKQGRVSEAMWRTLRILDVLDARQIENHVSASGLDVKLAYVKTYLSMLKKAGYLQVVQKGTPHRLERVRLKAAMNTGPRAPQVQRVKTVYDPNINKVMFAEDPEELQ